MPMRYSNCEKKNPGVILLLSMLLWVLLIPGHLLAQVTGATLSGTIKDESGSVVPNVVVVVKNLATDVVTKVTANADGFYTAPNLRPAGRQDWAGPTPTPLSDVVPPLRAHSAAS